MDQLKFNPVSHTALVTMDYLKDTDIPYAQDFGKLLKIEQEHERLVKASSEYQKYFKFTQSKIEARIKGSDYVIRNVGNSNVLDIACGFTSRCIYLSKEGYQYVGADLPYVIETIKPLVETFINSHEELHECKNKIQYSVVDATDYAAIEKATAHMSDPITVTCEGLLLYLPKYEQREVAKNIHRLLSKNGGVWITSDLDEQKYGAHSDIVANFVFQGVTDKKVSPDAFNSCPQALAMLEDVGFDISYEVFQPPISEISSLANVSEKEREILYSKNCRWEFLVLRCK
ncbi:MAG: class I SAM-dependent methyltransferase [Clostridia bacterium]